MVTGKPDRTRPDQTRPQGNNGEEEDRNIRLNINNKPEIHCVIRNQHQTTPQLKTHLEGGNVTCKSHTTKNTKRASIELLTNNLSNA